MRAKTLVGFCSGESTLLIEGADRLILDTKSRRVSVILEHMEKVGLDALSDRMSVMLGDGEKALQDLGIDRQSTDNVLRMMK